MISVDEALERILKSVRPLGSERVALAEAARRVLAEDVCAKLFNPRSEEHTGGGRAARRYAENDRRFAGRGRV